MDNDFNLVPEAIDEYVQAHTAPVDSLLEQLDRDTHVNVLCPRMLSGAYQGKLLEMISRMISPEKILEVGTYTGYSAICLAKGLRPGGRLTTIEHNPELEKRIRSYFRKAGLDDRVELLVGEAADLLPRFPAASFDLIFLDADKEAYLSYYPLLKRLLTEGGWLLIDNVLWNGKVADYRAKDKDTCLLRELNDKIQQDPEMDNVMLPVRDGLSLLRKIPACQGNRDFETE